MAQIKLPLPDFYDGRRDVLYIQAWFFQVEKYKAFYTLDEENTMKLVKTLLRGEAALWWQVREAAVAAHQIGDIATWNAFKLELQEEFEPKDYTFDIRTKMNKLFQNKKSVSEYTMEFRKLSILLPKANDDELVHRYLSHLNPDLANDVMRGGYPAL